MNAIIPALLFLVRHFLFVVMAMLAGCILWVITYFLLLVVALISDKGVGGPLALPTGLVGILVMCALLGWGVFAPASATGAILCSLLKLPRLAAIPIVTVAAFVLTYVAYWGYTALITTHSMPSVGMVLKNFVIYLSLPLGLYWWLTEGTGALFDSFRRWAQKRRRPETYPTQAGAQNS